jgi:hypothetical protein
MLGQLGTFIALNELENWASNAPRIRSAGDRALSRLPLPPGSCYTAMLGHVTIRSEYFISACSSIR